MQAVMEGRRGRRNARCSGVGFGACVFSERGLVRALVEKAPISSFGYMSGQKKPVKGNLFIKTKLISTY